MLGEMHSWREDKRRQGGSWGWQHRQLMGGMVRRCSQGGGRAQRSTHRGSGPGGGPPLGGDRRSNGGGGPRRSPAGALARRS